jgi:hypothetical protein
MINVGIKVCLVPKADSTSFHGFEGTIMSFWDEPSCTVAVGTKESS